MLQLGAVNTYVGGTVVNAGTLKGPAGSIQGNVNVAAPSATVTFDQATADGSYAGIVSGSGGLTKTGVRSLTLVGNNTYTGTTTIGKGTLRLSYMPHGASLWLDSSDRPTLFQNSDGTGPVTAAGQPVGYWADKSGHGKHATQTIAGNRPSYTREGTTINGMPVLTFDGVTDEITSFLNINPTSIPNLSLFIVYRQVADTADSGLWGHDNGGWDRFQLLNFSNGGQPNGYPIATSGSCTPVKGMDTTDPLVYVAVLKNAVASGSAVYINGLSDATHGLPAFTSADNGGQASITFGNIGAANVYHGNVQFGEILAFAASGLDDARRQAIESYLAVKWGIAGVGGGGGGTGVVTDHIADTSPVFVDADGIFDLSNNSETVGPLSGSGQVLLGNGTLTVNSLGDSGFSGVVGGAGDVGQGWPRHARALRRKHLRRRHRGRRRHAASDRLGARNQWRHGRFSGGDLGLGWHDRQRASGYHIGRQ